MAETQSRRIPNVVITGTPGTGKSSHAQLLVETCSLPLQHVNVGELVKEKKLYEDYDSEWKSFIVDDDKVLDEIEPMTEAGGLVLDWHTCDTFPERWVDLVVVLRCDHTLLWDRLEKRGYPLKKIQENNESEIMQTVLEEAKESYDEEIIVELNSEGLDDLESNVARIIAWIDAWRKDRGALDEDAI
ncbi:factor activating pos9 [Tulasnella sp. JGI-2019a]|nr:factor activating pos9 [Tulasnella sp. JGI-2019a]